jgi:hypothetical protein
MSRKELDKPKINECRQGTHNCLPPTRKPHLLQLKKAAAAHQFSLVRTPGIAAPRKAKTGQRSLLEIPEPC